jgi:bifunctional non-homologous end joining protein LigD
VSGERLRIEIGGYDVELSHPNRVVFPTAGYTKLDLVHYYQAVADGALRGAGGRPNILVRWVSGIDEPPFWQKRAPNRRPTFVDSVLLTFPSGRSAVEVVPRNVATIAWMVNLGCVELHPHPVRSEDLEHPDELRIDLDPGPGVEWKAVQAVALIVREVLEDFGLHGWPKTSGGRGAHVLVRIEPRWGFTEVRRAALAIAREVERRAPERATSKWWKEERRGVFLDYNQNAKDRTVASAYSVRAHPEARVSAPVRWEELCRCHPGDFTVATMPARLARLGDLHAGIDSSADSLEPLFAFSDQQADRGLGEAPWPPHYEKHPGEPARVRPSRAGRGRRQVYPLLEVARAEKTTNALENFERWKSDHPAIARHLTPEDVLVDVMRGRSSTWTRIRVNLRHVPEAERPR